MDTNRYDARTRAIINEIQDLLPKEGEQVFCALKHLEKTALQTDDAALAGGIRAECQPTGTTSSAVTFAMSSMAMVRTWSA